MRKCLTALLAAGLAQWGMAASIRGVVVEAATGNPLSHVRIAIEPVSGSSGKAATVRAERGGNFEASGLEPGSYTITASREGFLTAEYGQKRWNAAGMPVTIDEQHPAFLDFRLQRYGAVTGAVVDEQNVGILGHEVVAYRASDPQRPVGVAATDDRGVYRIGGLEPGSYVVRTKPKQIEDVSYLPTFGRETMLSAEAERVQADLDRTAETSSVHPKQGRLLKVAGVVVGTYAPFKVTFVSDMGRQTVETDGAFTFDPVPPGNYELYASGPGNYLTYTEGAYMLLALRDDQPLTVKMLPMHDTQIRIVDQHGTPLRIGASAPPQEFPERTQRNNNGRSSAAQNTSQPGVTLKARRIDMAGVGEPETFKIRGTGTARLAPGRWELRCIAPDGYWVSNYNGSRPKFGGAERPDGWHEITIEGYAQASFTLSPNPASVKGIVKFSGDPVSAAPVYLEPYDNARRERLWEPIAVRADVNGQYRFANLAPGVYRILSTFEFRSPTAEDFDGASARTITVDDGRETTLDLDLWGIR